MKNKPEMLEIEKHVNSFLALRIFFSLSVVVSHASGSTRGWRELSIGEFSLGTLAVFGFFVISGYLVTPGIFRSGVKRYSINRLTRIYPAYLISIATTVLIFLPIWLSQANLNISSFKLPTLFVLKNILLFPQSASSPNSTWNSLGGIPIYGSHPGVVNGSVWTLPLEITCYAALAILILLVRIFRIQNFKPFIIFIVSLVWATSICISIAIPEIHVKHDSHLAQLLTKWPFFLPFAVGVLIRVVFKVKFLKVALLPLGFFSLICMKSVLLWAVCGSVIFSFFWILIGESQMFNRFSNIRDISYGIYLYHFPVLQVLVGYEFLYKRFSVLLLSTLILSGCLAYFSSRFIEIPAQLFVKKLFREKNFK
jgi:peptidoglycan/LPS O-acetylase OafA/YrhL